MAEIERLAAFVAAQEDLGEPFTSVLNENLFDLYSKGEPPMTELDQLEAEIARMHKRLAEIKQRMEQIKSRNGIQSAPDQVGVRPVAQWIKPSDIPPGTGY